MVRGIGSLQLLLGKNVRQPKSRPTRLQSEEEGNCTPGTSVGVDLDVPETPPKEKSGEPGIQCPICTQQLHDDLELINRHIDRCLARCSRAPRQQTSMQSFFKRLKRDGDSDNARGSSTSAPLTSLPSDQEAATPSATSVDPACDAEGDVTSPIKQVPGNRSDNERESEGAQEASCRMGLAQTLAASGAGGIAAPGKCPWTFNTQIVGRRFHSCSAVLTPGAVLSLKHEPDNEYDSRAVVVAMGGHVVGHLPRTVAQHIGPLLQSGTCSGSASVLEAPATSFAAVPLEAKVSIMDANARADEVFAAVRSALSFAEKPQSPRRSTGEMYRKLMKAMLEAVWMYDTHVLRDEEYAFRAAFESLLPPAQSFYLRLSQRKGPYFRLDRIQYDDVPDLAAATRELAGAGMAHQLSVGRAASDSPAAKSLSLHEALAILSVSELSVLLKTCYQQKRVFVTVSSTKRSVLVREVEQLAAGELAESVVEVTRGTLGPVLLLDSQHLATMGRIQLLFSLSSSQGLMQSMATEVGAVRYPTYAIQRSMPSFATREQLVDYQMAIEAAAKLTDALEVGDETAAYACVVPAWQALDSCQHKSAAILGDQRLNVGRKGRFLLRFHAGWVYCMMATAGVSLLEKARNYREAVDRLIQLLGGVCCPQRRGEWWLRLSIDLEHLGQLDAALETAEAGLADDWLSQGGRLALQRRVLRLCKPPRRWKRPAWAPRVLDEPPEHCIEGVLLSQSIGIKSSFLGLDGQACSVEQLALQYYEADGWTGCHCEGGIWATLWGLLMWEVLFMPVPEVFRTPFHTAPLDLNSEGFFNARKPELEKLLQRIADGGAVSLLTRSWNEQFGVRCHGVSWDRWPLSELQEISECVGGKALAEVCRLLAEDHGGWSGGMPDLLLWKPREKRAKLVEVKGPRDRLSDQQRAWIKAIQASGMDVVVLRVAEAGKSSKRKASVTLHENLSQWM